MKVRDRTKSITDYDGRPTGACGAECPCRSCYHPHDCGYTHSYHGWITDMKCLTRYKDGCPYDDGEKKYKPEHIYSSVRGRVCKRCGERKAPLLISRYRRNE